MHTVKKFYDTYTRAYIHNIIDILMYTHTICVCVWQFLCVSVVKKRGRETELKQ